MSFLGRLFSKPDEDSVEPPRRPLTRIPDDGWVRVKVPDKQNSVVDPNLGGVLRVRLRDGIPIFWEPISTVDYLSESDLSFVPAHLVKRRLVDI